MSASPVRKRIALALFSAALLAAPGRLAAAAPADLDWAPPDAAAFVRVLPAAVWNSAALKDQKELFGRAGREAAQSFARHVGLRLADLERVTLVLPTFASLQDPFPNGDPEAVSGVFIFKTAKPYDRAALLQALSTDGRAKKHQGRTYYFHEDFWGALYLADETTALFGSEDAVLWLLQQRDRKKADGPLSKALALAAGPAPVVAGFNPAAVPAAAARSLPEALQPLLKAEAFVLSVEIEPKLALSARGDYASKEAAAKGEQATRALLNLGRLGLAQGMEQLEKERTDEEATLERALGAVYGLALLRQLDAVLEAAAVERRGEAVHALLSVDQAPGSSAVLAVVGVTSLGSNANSTFTAVGTTVGGEEHPELKKLYQAVEKYHADRKAYPPAAISDRDGRPLLSWRVALLPYLGEEELYKQFKFDEPWDSLHNKKLLKKLPKVYGWQGQRKTAFLRFDGPEALLDGARKRTRDDLRGRASSPALLVQVGFGQEVNWTKPADLPYSDKKPLPRLFGRWAPGSLNVLLADGTVRRVDTGGDFEPRLRALIVGDEKVPK